MSKLITCLTGIVVLAASASATPIQWPTSQGGNGHYYEAFLAPSWNGITWVHAQANAVSIGGNLVTVTTQAENDWVFENVASDPALWTSGGSFVDGPWLGGIQAPGSPPADGWSWVTGEPWTFTSWAPGQPDDYNGDTQDALHYWGGPNPGAVPTRLWDDVGRIHLMPSYIVEWMPEPASLMLFALVAGVLRRPR